MSLENYLTEYRDITVELMNKIKDQGNRLFLLKRRDDILDKINSESYKIEEIKKIYYSLGIENLENELIKEVGREMLNIKNEINKLKISSQGNQAYLTSRYGSAAIYSRFDKKY
ncbi:hypothetical protein [Clostridium butyricum]|uniref:hypothetical protein n=1 Tax=Clostridium butyricum TaxID=1492 RepID=UPI0022DFAFA5|nr:hypothetical protein [Clostridium butyricum]